MRISIVVPTYNRCNILRRTLPTVFAQDFPPSEYEVIVVIDGSTDGTASYLHGLRPACAFQILEQTNQGQAAAKNAGMRAARGDLILLLDDDILCGPSLVSEHAAAHHDGERKVVAAPVLVAAESRPGLATERACGFSDYYYRALPMSLKSRWPAELHVLPNCSLPRGVMLEVGGFDERFYRAHEDTELALRLWGVGVDFDYRDTPVTEQIFVKSADEVIRSDAKCGGRSDVLLCREHPEYRPFSELALLGNGRYLERSARELAARAPISVDPLMALPFKLAARFPNVSTIRRLASLLFRMRESSEFLRGAVAEAGSWRALRREFGMRLPVLMYHRIGPAAPGTFPSLTVPPGRFERQMRWLRRNGYTTITPSQWIAWRRNGSELPAKPVLLTFDDGYADTAEYALPVLKKNRMTATVFIVTGEIGGVNRWDMIKGSRSLRLMDAGQIRKWSDEGIEFGAHSRTHPDLTTLAPAQLSEEVAGSREDLMRLIGRPVVSFAYPYGYPNQAVSECAASAYEAAFTTEEGLNDLASAPALLRRVRIRGEDSMIDFICRVRLGFSLIEPVRSRIALRSRLRRAFEMIG